MNQTNAKTVFNRTMTICIIILIITISAYLISACSNVYGADAININDMIGNVYSSGTDFEYVLLIKTENEAYYQHSSEKETLYIEASENILKGTNENCNFIFVRLKNDQLFFENKNVLLTFYNKL